MSESVLGVIPDARIKTGMFKTEAWMLAVTDQRLLGARLSDERRKQVAEQAKAEAKAAGSGFFGQLGAKLRAGPALMKCYAAMTPEAILSETAGNWSLGPAQVKAVKVEHKTNGGFDDDSPEFHFVRITLETDRGKSSYDTQDDDPNQEQVRALLERVFGSRVR